MLHAPLQFCYSTGTASQSPHSPACTLAPPSKLPSPLLARTTNARCAGTLAHTHTHLHARSRHHLSSPIRCWHALPTRGVRAHGLHRLPQAGLHASHVAGPMQWLHHRARAAYDIHVMQCVYNGLPINTLVYIYLHVHKCMIMNTRITSW